MTAKEFLENKNIKEPTYEGVRLVDNKMGTYRIVELLEEYHQAKLKLLGIGDVSESFSKDDLLDLGGWFDSSPEFIEEVVNDWLNAR